MPRLALLGAFPFPAPFGSQRYFAAQAAALADAGAEITLCCYGSGSGESDRRFDMVRVAAALSPRRVRSGPALAKPVADLALGRALLRAASARGFDAVLAHNVEGAAIALAARALGGPPVVYVAHTLMAAELDAWLPRALASAAVGVGARLDRGVAARADAVLTLCEPAANALRPHARGCLANVAPGHAPQPPPDDAEIARACAEAGVSRDGFALYTGNFDRYQELPVLAAAARRVPEIPVVFATHVPGHLAQPGVRCLRMAPQAARALTYGAAVTLAARRREGGFPIKLLEYMEAGRAILARAGLCETLEHDRSAWLVPRDAGADAFVAALRALHAAPATRARLGAGARATLEARHAWPALASRILTLVETVQGTASDGIAHGSPAR
ncbi:MAG: glycosyltransferase family 4 protein [Deltaproteobacteria bacterium]|nr:glycosyltransferase family 4 protein [Deltaproteobacteria bacterium]MBW2360844.1 glycosyltransferase family 4 protein [Deltaproteobacteria bacterium]